MIDYSVAAQRMILLVYVLHHLSVANRIEALPYVVFIALIKSVAQERHHRKPHCSLFFNASIELLLLLVVLPSDNRQSKYAELLHPILGYHLANHFPIHKHPFFLKLESMCRLSYTKARTAPMFRYYDTK